MGEGGLELRSELLSTVRPGPGSPHLAGRSRIAVLDRVGPYYPFSTGPVEKPVEKTAPRRRRSGRPAGRTGTRQDGQNALAVTACSSSKTSEYARRCIEGGGDETVAAVVVADTGPLDTPAPAGGDPGEVLDVDMDQLIRPDALTMDHRLTGGPVTRVDRPTAGCVQDPAPPTGRGGCDERSVIRQRRMRRRCSTCLARRLWSGSATAEGATTDLATRRGPQ